MNTASKFAEDIGKPAEIILSEAMTQQLQAVGMQPRSPFHAKHLTTHVLHQLPEAKHEVSKGRIEFRPRLAVVSKVELTLHEVSQKNHQRCQHLYIVLTQRAHHHTS